MHFDNKKKDILVLGECPTQRLYDTKNNSRSYISYQFYRIRKKLVLRLNYNRSNSFLFVNATKIYQFKANSSEIKPYPLCLGNILKDFTINYIKKTELKRTVKVFSIDYNSIDTNNILDIHRYLMKEI